MYIKIKIEIEIEIKIHCGYMIQLAAYEEDKTGLFTDSVTDLRSEIFSMNIIYHIETYKKLYAASRIISCTD